MDKKRLVIGLVLGALLGVVCIIGAQLRTSGQLSTTYLFSFWFNRVLIGLVIGIALQTKQMSIALIRGLILGLVVSFGFYSATGFADITGFFAGVVYGVIIEFVLFKYANSGDIK
ncbi:MAG: hypothetical protein JXC31_00325 [Acholeplasmataceae bacterium]|nr:hypothetical protein [Acholeplasmataceae bacterium]